MKSTLALCNEQRIVEIVLNSELADRLSSVGLFDGLDEPSRQALADELILIEFAAGETLFRQGDEADSVYVLLDGKLSVRLEQRGDAEDQLLNELHAGDVVGEVALVAGGRRSATVVVDEASQLAQLPVAVLNPLLEAHPEISRRMFALVSRRLRRSQLAAQLENLFDGLDTEILAEIEQAIEWRTLRAGERLYEAGDPGDAAYLIVSGRVRVVAFDPEERLLHEVGRGDMVGETALVEDLPREATVFAARDSDLARLPRSAFEKLLEQHPLAMLGVARTVFRRFRAPTKALRHQLGADLSVAIIPTRPGLDLEPFIRDLADTLGLHGSTIRLDPERVDAMLGKPGIANSDASSPAHIRLLQSLHEIEDEHRFVIYEADSDLTSWSERAIRQADFLLSVGDGRGVDPPSETERAVASSLTGRHPRWSLALVHPARLRQPTGTARWFEGRAVESVYHVHESHRGDMERVARILAGRAVGVVFGGGGARGFAHLGVLRALEEIGVPIDMVGGTSMGAPLAAFPACELTAAESLAISVSGFDSILEYTLPLVSVMSGSRITGSIVDQLGGWEIEDLWRPYYCVSTNLTKACEVVHRRGNLARAVRASVAIPGVLPPVPEGEDLLVDGGVLNNLPIDVMREMNPTGPIITIDVVPPRGPGAQSDYGLSISGWRVALSRLLPGEPIKAPGIGGTMMRSMMVGAESTRQRLLAAEITDFYLNVRMRKVGMLEFDAVEPIEKLGYEQSIDALREWVDGGGLES
ncbi:MAG: cyclic nucleotide-binding and patatin-like phospholipase domain-containing protein [Myxococcota bacterium]